MRRHYLLHRTLSLQMTRLSLRPDLSALLHETWTSTYTIATSQERPSSFFVESVGIFIDSLHNLWPRQIDGTFRERYVTRAIISQDHHTEV
jgi:hypothetical protein